MRKANLIISVSLAAHHRKNWVRRNHLWAYSNSNNASSLLFLRHQLLRTRQK